MATARRSAVLLAAVALMVSGCIPVGPAALVAGAWAQDTPQVASDGTNALVVWRDYRNGHGNGDIFGAIVAADQSIVLTNIPISTQAGTESSPNVAFDGTNYIVVWGDRRGGAADLYGARVSPAGEVLDADGVLLAGGAFDQRRPALAFDGTNFLVVYEETSSLATVGISAKRIAPDLTVVDASPVSLATEGEDAGYPDVVFDGVNFVAAWTETYLDNADVMVRRVSPAGVALSPIPLTDDNDQTTDYRAPALVFDGANTMIAYVGYQAQGGSAISGQRVDLNGSVVDTTPIVFVTYGDPTGGVLGGPDLAWDGTDYVLAYWGAGDYSLFGQIVRVDSTGAQTSVRRGSASNPRVTMIGDVALVASVERALDSDDQPGVFTSGFAANDETIAGGPLAGVPGPQDHRTISFGDGVYLLVWYDHTGVYASRFGSNLEPSAGTPISLGFARGAPVEAVFNGTNFLLVGQDSLVPGAPVTRIVTISPNGDVLRSEIVQDLQRTLDRTIVGPFGPLPVYRSYQTVDIATSGSTSMIVAQSSLTFGPREALISTLVVDEAGVPVSSLSTAASSPSSIAGSSAAWDGSRYHVVWSDDRGGTADIFGTTVAANGTPLNTVGTVIGASPERETAPRIAASPSEIVVAWQRGSNATSAIQAQRIGNTGVPIGGAVDVASGSGSGPDVVFSDHLAIVWTESVGIARFAIKAARFENGAATSLGTVTTAESSSGFSVAPAVPGAIAVTHNDTDRDVSEFSTAYWRIFYS
jgi:hypothetical protein